MTVDVTSQVRHFRISQILFKTNSVFQEEIIENQQPPQFVLINNDETGNVGNAAIPIQFSPSRKASKNNKRAITKEEYETRKYRCEFCDYR